MRSSRAVFPCLGLTHSAARRQGRSGAARRRDSENPPHAPKSLIDWCAAIPGNRNISIGHRRSRGRSVSASPLDVLYTTTNSQAVLVLRSDAAELGDLGTSHPTSSLEVLGGCDTITDPV